MDVLLGALELLGVEEFRVRSIKDLDAVIPTEPVAKLGSDDRRQWGADRHDDDIDVMAGSAHTDASSEESCCNK